MSPITKLEITNIAGVFYFKPLSHATAVTEGTLRNGQRIDHRIGGVVGTFINEYLVPCKLVEGWGINDLSSVKGSIRGHIPAYTDWVNMLERCFCPKMQAKHPTYKGCKVHPDWRFLSNFKQWADKQFDYANRCLDKDLLGDGSKTYSPDTCCYLTSSVNKFLINGGIYLAKHRMERGLPIGVQRNGQSGFMANVGKGNGTRKYLGTFGTPIEAFNAFRQEKASLCLLHSKGEPDHIRRGLERYSEYVLSEAYAEEFCHKPMKKKSRSFV